MRVVHQELDGAQRTVVLADDVGTRGPRPRVIADGIAVLVGTIDEALVLPSVSPRVGNNPGTDFVLVGLAHLAVAIKVELDAVVVTADREGMVVGIAPRLHVLHAGHTCCLVSGGTGDDGPGAVGCDADARDAAAVHRRVAAVVVEPFLQLLPALGCVGRGKAEVVGRAVPHGAVPFVIALHPAVVGIVVCLRPEESAVGTSAVGRDVGDAVAFCHSFRRAGLIGHQPSEMRRVLILGQRSIGIAIAVYLMGELIANACSRAAGAAVLIEDGREVLVLAVIDIGGQLNLCFGPACLAPCRIVGRLGTRCHVIPEVGEHTAVYLHYLAVGQDVVFNLCHAAQGWHKACYQQQTLKVSHSGCLKLFCFCTDVLHIIYNI